MNNRLLQRSLLALCLYLSVFYSHAQTLSFNVTNSTCESNGIIEVSCNGCSSNVEYEIIAGPICTGGFCPVSDDPAGIFSSLLPGTYTVQAISGSTVEVDSMVTIFGNYQEPEPFGRAIFSCPGMNNGAIDIYDVVNGNDPYLYRIFTGDVSDYNTPIGPAEAVVPFTSTTLYNNLANGEYSYQVKDSCDVIRTGELEITNVTNVELGYITNCDGGLLCLPQLIIRSQIGTIPLSDPRLASIFPLHVVRVNSDNSIDTVQTLLAPALPDPIPVLNCGGNVQVRLESECGIVYDLGSTLIRCVPENVGSIFLCNENDQIYRRYFYGSRSGVCPSNVVTSIYTCGFLGNPDSLIFQGLITDFEPILVQPDTQRYDIITDNTCTNVQDTILCFDPVPYVEEFPWAYIANCGPGASIAIRSSEPLEVISAPPTFPHPLPYSIPVSNVSFYGLISVPEGQYQIQREICSDSILTLDLVDYNFDLEVTNIDIDCDVTTFDYAWTSNFPDSIPMYSQRLIFGSLNSLGNPVPLNVPGAFEQLVIRLEPNGQRSFSIDNELCPEDLGLYLVDVAVSAVTCDIDLSDACYEAPDGISVLGLPCNNGIQSCADGSQPYNVVVTAPISGGVAPYTFEVFEGGTNTLFTPAITTSDTSIVVEQVCQSDLSLDIFVTDFCGQQIMSEIGANILSGSLLLDTTETICTGDTFDLDVVLIDYIQGGSWTALDGGPLPNANNEIIATDSLIGCFMYSYDISAQNIEGICDNSSVSFELCLEGGLRVICPDSLILQCDDMGIMDSLQQWISSAEVEGICDTVLTSYTLSTSLLSSTSSPEYVSIDLYEFLVTDNFGNTASCEAVFATEDTIAPVVIIPTDTIIYDCPNDYSASLNAWLSGFSVSDNCSTFSESVVLESIEEPCLNNQGYVQLVYSFNAIDEQGNQAFDSLVTSSFTVIDTLLPLINAPSNLVMNCSEEHYGQILYWLEQYEVLESCQSYTVSTDWDGSLPNWCAGDSMAVTFTVMDACGATAISESLIIIESDSIGPVFDQCPLVPIVVDAPESWCSAFVNYTIPTAQAACSSVTVEQTDSTGYNSGDLFPVGLTTLEFTATDSCGNSSQCALKIFVNDFHTTPQISCPTDITVSTDLGSCLATVSDLSPENLMDNCIDHVFLYHEIYDASGMLIEEGIGDASGQAFPLGENEVIYTAVDQPMILISEIIQDGLNPQIELSNFGPADMDISCLEIRSENDQGNEQVYIVPNGTVLSVGSVFVFSFDSTEVTGSEVLYTIGIVDRIIDSVEINQGILIGEQIIRISPINRVDPSSWEVVTECNSGSMGVYNPELPIVQSNGALTSLQSTAASESSCSFIVTVEDIEAPICAQMILSEFTQENEAIGAVQCIASSLTLDPAIISDLNIRDLVIELDSLEVLDAYLQSPSGQQIHLFTMDCPVTSDINLSLDDQASVSINQASCNPYGGGMTYQPLESLTNFTGENAAGTWTLSLESAGIQSGTIVQWTLEVTEQQPYSQLDTILVNDSGICGANFSWTHPTIGDACSTEGSTMMVRYQFENTTTGISTEVIEILVDSTGSISLGGSVEQSFFEVGTTIIEYFLEDAQGNASSCSFEVIVVDEEAPTILNDCADITIQLDGGDCTAGIIQQTNFTDNCEIDSFSYSSNGLPIDVSALEIGEHVIDLEVVDIYGNSSVCSFTVVVEGYEQIGTQLVCNNNLNISLNEDCEAILTPDILLEGDNYACYDNYCIVVRDLDGNIVDNYFDLDDINETFEVSIEDCNNSGNSCWGYVTIEYKLIPEIACPDTVQINCSTDATAVYPSGHPEEGRLITGSLELLSCVADPEISYSDHYVDAGSCSDPRAYIERTWILNYGNDEQISCEQIIEIQPFNSDQLTFPIDYNLSKALSCSAVAQNPALTEPENTGYPSIDGASIYGASYCDINMGYWDEVLQDVSCPNAYEILRHWTVSNECVPIEIGVNPIVHIQRIKVEDNEAPSIANIADVTISTDAWSCYGSYTLPVVEFSEDCGTVSLEWSVSYGSINGNEVSNLLPGITTITVKATDACGNFSTSSFEITTVDQVPPTVIAETSHAVSLSADGVAKLYAEDLDDGSHDFCGDISFHVKRMDDGPLCSYDEFPPAGNDNAQFNEVVFFCCEDVQEEPILVQFQVCDEAGNCNLAMVEVYVQDKLAPQIICPGPVTISCNDLAGIDLSDTDLLDELFGSAEAAATCSVSVSQTAVSNEDCGAGVIFRNFTASNSAGTNSCQQIITVQSDAQSQLTCDRISFTDINNSIYNWCAVNDNQNNNNDDLPALSVDCNDGVIIPTIAIDIDGLCTEAGQSVEVDSFLFEGGACKKYVVHYEVIDQCLFDENYVDPVTNEIDPYQSENGYFEMYIEVDAFDNSGPELDCATQEFVANSCTGYSGSVSITGTDNCTDAGYFGYLWRLDLDMDNEIDYPSTSWAEGNEVSPTAAGLTEFPIGTHRIFWLVSDGCGNETSCSQLISITEEEKAPTPYCYDGLSTSFMGATGTVSLWANDFNAGSFDNCADDLVFSMIPESDVIDMSFEEAYAQSFSHSNVTQEANGAWGFQFDCSYIPNGVSAILEIRMYVTDAAGNYDYCTASLRLEDNLDACEDIDTGTLKLSGKVKTENAENIALVDMELDANYVEFPKEQTTMEDGAYSFESLYSMIDYRLSPYRNDDHLNGVSTLDIVKIQKHILGLEVLTSPYQLIAADVNQDCQINGQDLIQIRRLILGKYPSDEFPENTSWKFVLSDYEFVSGQQPCNYEESVEYIALESSKEQDFYGVKVGDINGSVEANLQEAAAIRTDKTIDLQLPDLKMEAGQIYRIPVRLSSLNHFWGMQFALEGEAISFVDVSSGQISIDARNYLIQKNHIRISIDQFEAMQVHDSDILYYIHLRSEQRQSLAQALEIRQEKLSAEVYIEQEIEEAQLELRIGSTLEENDLDSKIVVHQNEPNPFKSITKVRFYNPTAQEVRCSVFNIQGSLLYESISWYDVGEQSIVLNKKDLSSSSGVFYYEFQIGNEVIRKRMLLVD